MSVNGLWGRRAGAGGGVAERREKLGRSADSFRGLILWTYCTQNGHGQPGKSQMVACPSVIDISIWLPNAQSAAQRFTKPELRQGRSVKESQPTK
jgi:hypothetical protein